MNRTDLQNDFYKRFSVSTHNLIFSKSGLLCTLLGHSEIKNSGFISCTLSMCIHIAGRRLDSNTVKLENTKSGVCTVFQLNDLPSGKKSMYDIISEFNHIHPFGAELLYNSTIPQCFSQYAPLRVTVLNTLLKLAETESSISQKAIVCAAGSNPAPYSAMFSAKKGWCTLTQGTDSKNLPLPLTGYRLLAVQTNAKYTARRTAAVEKAFSALRKIYPHVTSMDDLSFDMLDYAKSHIKHTEMNYMRHILSENERINAAKTRLKACRIEEFADIVNSSQRSIERLWGCCDEHSFLAASVLEASGCLCARQWKNGIIAIISEESLDNTINILRRSFSSNYGYNPVFCVSDTCGTE